MNTAETEEILEWAGYKKSKTSIVTWVYPDGSYSFIPDINDLRVLIGIVESKCYSWWLKKYDLEEDDEINHEATLFLAEYDGDLIKAVKYAPNAVLALQSAILQLARREMK